MNRFLQQKGNLRIGKLDDKIEKIMNPDKEGALCIHGSMWKSPIFAIGIAHSAMAIKDRQAE